MGAATDLVKNLLKKKGNGSPASPVPSASQNVTVLPATLIEQTALQQQTMLPAALDAGMPTLRAPGGIEIPAIREPMLPATAKYLRKPPVEHSAEDRALRDEKVLFVRLVEECKQDHRQGSATGRRSWRSLVSMGATSRVSARRKKGEERAPFQQSAALARRRHRKTARPGLRNPATGKVEYSRADLLLKNYGQEHVRYGDDAFWTEIMAVCNNLSAPQIKSNYRLLVQKYTAQRPGAEIPTISQVRYEIGKLPKRLLLLNRKGENYYNQHIRDYNERDPETIRPNEAWVADTQECDFFIRAKDAEGNWKAVRPWICVIVDIKSEHVIDWEMGADPISNTVIRNTFGRGVFYCGRPYVFLTDNGKDYLKMGFTDPVVFTPDVANSKVYEHSIMKALGVEHRKAEAYNGRAKYVERFFQGMAQHYRRLRGYTGPRPADRPATADVWTKPVNAEYLMSIEEACFEMFKMIDFYHNTPAKGSKFLKGMTPAEAFAPENRVARADMSYADLYRAFLLPEAKPRIVDPRGPSVTVDKQRYVALREERERLWKYDDMPVMVKFDISSRDYCFLFDLDGTYICAAHKPELLPYFCRTPEERARLADHQKAIKSEIKTLNTYTYEMTNGFHKLDVASSYALPPEEFESAAKLCKLDTKHSVKGESHNPAIYITQAEKDRHDKGQDLQLVCTDKKVLRATPSEPPVDPVFKNQLVGLLTGEEVPVKPAIDTTAIYQQEETNDEQPEFRIPDDF